MDVVVAGADEEVAVAGCCVGDEEVGGDVAGEEEDGVEEEWVEHLVDDLSTKVIIPVSNPCVSSRCRSC